MGDLQSKTPNLLYGNLTSRIAETQVAGPATDTTKQEAEIDRPVYELYGLTTKEIAAVEGPKQQR